jgi:signal transduction histidine kinase
MGVPEELKNKIFDRFYRVRNAQVNTFPGLGLGLYIASIIIHQHGGRIWLDSTLNKGSTFYFLLPCS